MSHVILHLLKHKIDGGKGLRYLNVRLSKDADIITPLFFGTDLLNNSGINPSNHCRIHTRYAKVGLATKIIFPPDVAISGLTHCQNGAWFYSIQGVFQVIFEHQSRKIQLKIVTSLIDTWQSVEGDPKLPRKLSVSLQELQTTLLPPEEAAKLKRKPLIEKRTVMETSIVVDSTSDCDRLEKLELINREEEEKDKTTFQQFNLELLRRVENYAECCCNDEKYLADALISFLRLIYRDSKAKIGQVFGSFLQTITIYGDLVSTNNSDSKTLNFGESDGLSADDNQNLLLCLMSKWLGKHLNEFKDSIAKKADLFKVENFSSIDDLPPAHNLVSRLFPDCMRLLVGYWIGLYGSPPPPPPQDLPVGKKLNDRQDHSYSTSVQTVKIAGGKREDHSYSTSNPTLITTTTTWLETVPIPPPPQPPVVQPQTRDDHTYVHYENTDADPIVELPKTRKDHTYVSTKEPKASKLLPQPPSIQIQHQNQPCQIANNSLNTVQEESGGPPVPKRTKLTPNNNSKSTIDIPYVVDPTKHSFVLLILEFLNNVLISGIGHVVYTRLIQTN